MVWLGPVKPHVRKCAEAIRAQFGDLTIGGFATTGHIAGSYHYLGQALDVMIPAKNRPRLGDAVNAWVKSNAAQYGVIETIWNGEYWTPGHGASPTKPPTNPHTTHVHISFNAQGDTGSGGEVQQASSDELGCLKELGILAILFLAIKKLVR